MPITPRCSSRRLLVVASFLWGASSSLPGHATPPPLPAVDLPSPLDRVLPFEPPSPNEGLEVFLSGAPFNRGRPDVSVTWERPDPEIRSITRPEPGRGLVFAFGATSWIDGALRPRDDDGSFTVALWVRVQTEAFPDPIHLNPIIGLDPDPDPHAPGVLDTTGLALVLEDGYPTVRNAGVGTPLFGADGDGSPNDRRLDDGQWHHVALTMNDLCAVGGECPDGLMAGELRMFVDGDLVGWHDLYMPRPGSFQLGYMTCDEAYADEPLFTFLGPGLRSATDIDEVFIYSRALSREELHRLADRPELRLVATWPPVPPELMGLPHDGPVRRADGYATPQSFVPIPGASAGASYVVAAVPSAPTTPVRELAADAVVTGAATAIGWVRPRADKALGLELVRYDPGLTVLEAVRFELQPEGDHHRARARCGTAASFVDLGAVTSDWHLVTLARDADADLRVDVDGFEHHLACPFATPANSAVDVRIVDAGAAPSGTPVGDVAWLALYGTAIGRAESLGIGKPGPYVWVKANPDGPVEPIEYAGVLPVRWNGTYRGDKMRPRPAGADFRANAVIVDADGALARDDSFQAVDTPERVGPFTLTLSFKVSRAPTPTPIWVTLATRHVRADDRLFDIAVLLRCDVSGCDDLSILTPPTDGNGGGATSKIWVVDRPIAYDTQTTVTISWPNTRSLPQASNPVGDIAPYTFVTEPLVSIDGVEMGRATMGDLARLMTGDEVLAGHPLRGHTQPTTAGVPMSWSIGAFGEARAGEGPGFSVGEIRLYGRSLADVTTVDGDCVAALCADKGRECIVASSTNVGTASCGECLADSFALAATVTGEATECEKRRGNREVCSVGEQCSGGACLIYEDAQDRCGPGTQAEATAVCRAEGRRAVSRGALGGYDCGECLAGFERLATHEAYDADDPRLRCRWAPTAGFGDACTSDLECVTGGCVDNAHVSYEVSAATRPYTQAFSDHVFCGGTRTLGSDSACTVQGDQIDHVTRSSPRTTERACAADDDAACHRLGKVALRKDGVLPTGEAATWWQCGVDDASCRAGFEPRWSVLSPEACETLWRKAYTFHQEGYCDVYTAGDCTVFGGGTDKYPWLVYPAWRDAFRTAGAEVDLGTLGQALLDKAAGDRMTLKDVTRLEELGVGPLLLSYLGNKGARADLERRFGAFLPLASCALDATGNGYAPRDQRAYREANELTCAPHRQDDGAMCPGAGESGDGNDWCRSRYCARDTHTCARGDNPLQEIRGQAQNDESSGGQGVKFGIIRCDDTTLEVEENQAPGIDPTDDDWRYTADLSQSWNLCMFGHRFPPVPLLEVDYTIDHSEGARCAENETRASVIGIPISSPPPGPLLGSCTGLVVDADGVCTPPEGGCELADPTNFSASSLIAALTPQPSLCVPIPDSFKDAVSYKRTFLAGPVPISVQIGATIDMCLELHVGMGDSGMPKLELKPLLAVGAEARAGLGYAERGSPIEAWAGVKLALTFASIALPIGWGIDFDLVFAADPNRNGEIAPVLKMSIGERVMLQLEYLSGEMALFAEITVGPFAVETAVQLFAWTGIKMTKTLSDETLYETNVDFRFDPGLDLQSGGESSVCDGECR